MYTAMALSAHVDADIEFFFAKTPTEALAAVLSGDKVMKSKRHQPLAASAGRCVFMLSHGALVTPADSDLVDEVA